MAVNRLRQNSLLIIALFCFFFSGVAGLVYWYRENRDWAKDVKTD